MTWLKQHFTEPVAVDEQAERANMSPSTFRQHFRAITTMSPVTFQKRLRLQEARQLMLTQGTSGPRERVGWLRECVPVQPRVPTAIWRAAATRCSKRTDGGCAAVFLNGGRESGAKSL